MRIIWAYRHWLTSITWVKKVLMINRYRGISIIDAWHVKREVISYLQFFIMLSSEIWKPDLFQITWYAFPGTYFCRIIIYISCFSDWDFGIFSMKLIEYVFIFSLQNYFEFDLYINKDNWIFVIPLTICIHNIDIE